MLTREAIVAASDLPRERLTVPEWGGDVWIKTMSSVERDAWEAGWQKWWKAHPGSDDGQWFDAFLAVHVLCDEQGKPLFGPADVDLVARKSGKALARIRIKATRLNLLTDAEIGALEKNCESGQSVDSGNSSPEPSFTAP